MWSGAPARPWGVKRAEDWRLGSLWVRRQGRAEMKGLLTEWPVRRPRDWVQCVNEPLTTKELEAVRVSVARGRPYGDRQWQEGMIGRLHLEPTVRSEGRPTYQGTSPMIWFSPLAIIGLIPFPIPSPFPSPFPPPTAKTPCKPAGGRGFIEDGGIEANGDRARRHALKPPAA